MLYKNDELYKLAPADIKKVRDKFKKFPVALVYPENRLVKSPSKHNIKPDKPNSISFPLSATVKTSTGTDQWRYAENKLVDSRGKIIYTPHNFLFFGNVMLSEQDMELIWFLMTKCPYVIGGENYNGRPPKAVFEDLVGAADKKAMTEEQHATMKALIYSKQIGLKEEKLRKVAKAYFIPEVDDLTINQVRIALEIAVTSDRVSGIDSFMKLVEADIELEVRSVIQDAVDRKIIKYIPNTKEWAWLTDGGRKHEAICTVHSAMNPNEAIFDYYMGDKNFADTLKSAMKGNKVVLRGSEESPPDEEAEK